MFGNSSERYLFQLLNAQLREHRQMIFLSGPRQVGKTTLSKQLLGEVREGENYFNWDVASHRRMLLSQIFSGKTDISSTSRLCFDEIHKYKRWKNALKGLFDLHEPNTHWIVTGSANLSVYRKGQDSMVGRYFSFTLHPYSVAELLGGSRFAEVEKVVDRAIDDSTEHNDRAQECLNKLMSRSGFPEPLFQNSPTFLGRWRASRIDRLIHQDLFQTEDLKNLPLVEHLVSMLPERVASPLSINSLRLDLEVHFETAKHWLNLLERVYYGFFVRPYQGSLTRALKKEAKFYLWDWTEVEERGKRFENLVGAHLLKFVDFVNQLGLDELSLHFAKDKEGHEVDFLICRKRKPWIAIECKANANANPSGIYYFSERFDIPHSFVLSLDPIQIERRRIGKRMITRAAAADFLSRLI